MSGGLLGRCLPEALFHASVEDLVRDVIARDQALDAYERYVRSKMEARERRIAELENQAAALRDQCERLRLETRADETLWGDWRARKRSAERELADAIAYLVDRPIVTMEEDEEDKRR